MDGDTLNLIYNEHALCTGAVVTHWALTCGEIYAIITTGAVRVVGNIMERLGVKGEALEILAACLCLQAQETPYHNN